MRLEEAKHILNENGFLIESKQDDAIEIFAKIYGVSVNTAWDLMGDLQHDIDLDRLFNSSMSAKDIAFKILDQYEYDEEVAKRLEEYKRTGTITPNKTPKKHRFSWYQLTVVNSKNEKRDYSMFPRKYCTKSDYLKYGMQVFIDNVKNKEYTEYGISSIDDIKEIKSYRIAYGDTVIYNDFKPDILNYMIDKGYVKV